MENALVHLLIVAIIICIVLAICYVIVSKIAARFPPWGEIIMLVFYGLAAIVVLLKIVVPLLTMV